VLFFNKVLPLLCLPFGVVCCLVLLALALKKWWPGLVALAVLWICSLPVTGDGLIRLLERRYPVIPVAEAGPADAIIVLGGILGPAHRAGTIPNWTESVERFEAAVALMAANRAPQLVFTGARRSWLDGETTEGEELRKLAVARGVPAEKILVTRFIDNTATEAAAVAERVKAGRLQRVILVTTAWHMPRAVYLFRKAGVECIPFPVDFRADAGRPWGWSDFVPSAGGWAGTETALRELYGYAFYRVFR
jgi:uncharacterized SAM-binding protein YcdF (DUF218 family)